MSNINKLISRFQQPAATDQNQPKKEPVVIRKKLNIDESSIKLIRPMAYPSIKQMKLDGESTSPSSTSEAASPSNSTPNSSSSDTGGGEKHQVLQAIAAVLTGGEPGAAPSSGESASKEEAPKEPAVAEVVKEDEAVAKPAKFARPKKPSRNAPSTAASDVPSENPPSEISAEVSVPSEAPVEVQTEQVETTNAPVEVEAAEVEMGEKVVEGDKVVEEGEKKEEEEEGEKKEE